MAPSGRCRCCSFACRRRGLLMGVSGTGIVGMVVLLFYQSPAMLPKTQHIYIVRHGDKYSSYPACVASQSTDLCYNRTQMGNNPALTPCGRKQANLTAAWLQGKISSPVNILVSPFARTLQTSLQIAQALKANLLVEESLSEARILSGPFRAFNVEAPSYVQEDLLKCNEAWDRTYSRPPIKTPENRAAYARRIVQAAEVIKEQFPPSSGSLILVTHGLPAFSLAFYLCHPAGTLDEWKAFVARQAAIAPAGIIHVQVSGSCAVSQTQNVAQGLCGRTHAYKPEGSELK